MIKFSFQPKDATKKLLFGLTDRSRDVLTKRYGLGKDTTRMTLEAIGQQYNITRERVRQVEEHSLAAVRDSEEYENLAGIFSELRAMIDEMGGVVCEDEFLNSVSKTESVRNNIHFLLVVGDAFIKHKEDDHFRHRWSVDNELAKSVEESIQNLYENLSDDAIIPESEMIKNFLNHIKDISGKYRNEEILKRWLGTSKKISKNPLGEWGRATSSNINVKGIRDYAYLVLRKHGSPIHFRELANQIAKTFDRKAHVATCHNELIKDPRFVLVGRGTYALSDWGYSAGVVRDVIANILKKNGPLTKSEIIDKVLKERFVKENTIAVNLQNTKHFKKDSKGRYNVVA